MFDVELWIKQRRRQASNLYVTDTRDFAAIRHDSLQAIQNFMSSRLSYDDTFERCINRMTSFANFTANDNDIRLVHQNIAPDTDLAKLAASYKDIYN